MKAHSWFLILIIDTTDIVLAQRISELTTYFRGDLPVILSVPHGGLVDVPSIPYRLSGCLAEGASRNDPKEKRCDFEAPHNDRSCIDSSYCGAATVTDDFTIELALTIANRLEELMGRRPHVVQCNLLRSKVDVNRAVGEAAQGNRVAQQVYNNFHNYLSEAKNTIGRGLVLDLHGQSNRQNSTEIGYLLTTSQLNSGFYGANSTSVRLLASQYGLSGDDLLTGPKSFGSMLEMRGYKALPSPRQPYPGSDRYYPGGYIVRTHGSLHGGSTDAVCLETPREVRIDGGVTTRDEFGRALADVISAYITTYYDA